MWLLLSVLKLLISCFSLTLLRTLFRRKFSLRSDTSKSCYILFIFQCYHFNTGPAGHCMGSNGIFWHTHYIALTSLLRIILFFSSPATSCCWYIFLHTTSKIRLICFWILGFHVSGSEDLRNCQYVNRKWYISVMITARTKVTYFMFLSNFKKKFFDKNFWYDLIFQNIVAQC